VQLDDFAPFALNDLLIGLTAREIGATVVTRNREDFARIATVVPGLAVTAPWSAGAHAPSAGRTSSLCTTDGRRPTVSTQRATFG